MPHLTESPSANSRHRLFPLGVFTVGIFTLAIAALLGGPSTSLAKGPGRPLHQRIDEVINKVLPGPASAKTSDAAFVRRVYLDFTGRIPTATQTKSFLSDTNSEKRSKLIDALLKEKSFPEHMANVFHIMLMERRGEEAEWQRFLVDSFQANKPWNVMAKEIVTPKTESESTRGAAYFYTKRLEKYGQNPVDYPGLVRDVGRMFLGVDVQCAQCHDHLFVDAYKQVDYQGLFAFVGTTFIRRDTKFPAVAEKPLLKKVEFQSVFEMDPMSTGPRLPGRKEVSIPEFKRGEEYRVPPDRKTKEPGVPKFSTLEVLGAELTNKDNELFARNIANRLWWVLMGRGIVDPLDLHHVDNPPSHPELLALLSREVVEHDFDMQYLLREIALSDTYQRSSLLPEQASDSEPQLEYYQTAFERPLSAKQLLDSILLSTGMADQIVDPSAAKKETATDQVADKESESDQDKAKQESYDELLKRFRAAFANPPREPEIHVNSTVKAALFLMHDPVVLSWLQPAPGNLIERVSKIAAPREAVNELYLAVLSRTASEEEMSEAEAHLKACGGDKAKAWSQLAWALLASTEFFVNH